MDIWVNTGVGVPGETSALVGGGSGVSLGGTDEVGELVGTGVLVGTTVLVGTSVLVGIAVADGRVVAVPLGMGVAVDMEVAVSSGNEVALTDGEGEEESEESSEGLSRGGVSGALLATGGCAMKASTSSMAVPLFSKVILIYRASCGVNWAVTVSAPEIAPLNPACSELKTG